MQGGFFNQTFGHFHALYTVDILNQTFGETKFVKRYINTSQPQRHTRFVEL